MVEVVTALLEEYGPGIALVAVLAVVVIVWMVI